jgi:dTDP-glucose 4,6-dehydratase
MNKNKPILVTGAAGFIGCHFVKYMMEKYTNLTIISLDHLTYAGSSKNLEAVERHPNHIFVKGDICDSALIENLLKKYQIHTIVHFAAESHVDRSLKNPQDFVKTNVFGTFNLLENAKKYWLKDPEQESNSYHFHHISTDEVYGALKENEDPFTEKHPYAPNSPYSASKASSDHFVRAYFQTYGLPVTISNCSNNYGPHQHPEKFVPTVIRACLHQKPIPLYGNGSHMRDWLFVTDHCAALDLILCHARAGEKYNIGGNCELSNLDLVKKICALMDEIKPEERKYFQLISFVKDRLGHDWRYAIDNSKIQKDLKWTPSFNLHEGLKETILYYLKQGV